MNLHDGAKPHAGAKLHDAMMPDHLAAQLGKLLPEQLKCIVLYGSAAAGDFVPGASNYNLLILVEPLTVRELDIMSPTVVAWNRSGNPSPLVFTPAGFISLTDAFPIELLDIQQSRRVLWGPDLLAQIEIHPEHLRLQVERELTGKLLSLRGHYLLAGGHGESQTKLMLRSLSTILVLFRAALRLYQSDVPDKKLDALHELRKHVQFEMQPFEKLFAMKQESPQTRAADAVSFESYLKAIETVAGAVNQLSQARRSDA